MKLNATYSLRGFYCLLVATRLVVAAAAGNSSKAASPLVRSHLDGNDSGSATPPNDVSPRILYLLSLLPYPVDPAAETQGATDQLVWSDGQSVYLAGELAVELINNSSDILDGYSLKLLQGDSACNIVSRTSVELLNKLFYNGGKHVLGIAGPGCSGAGLYVSRVISTEEDDISLISIHLGGSPLFDARRGEFPYSFSMVAHTETVATAIIELMKYNNWKDVIVLYDESQIEFSTLLERFHLLLENDSSIPVASLIYENYIPFNAIRASERRIILLLVGSNLLSRILCVFFRQNFTYPLYQWIFVSRSLDQLRLVSTKYEGIPVTCQVEELLDFAQQSIFLEQHLEPLDKTRHSYFGLSYNQYIQSYEERVRNFNSRTNSSLQPSIWGTPYFDTISAMALALNNSISELRSKNLELAEFEYGQNQVTNIIRKNLIALSFEGVSGRVKFNTTNGFVNRGIDIKQLRDGKLKQMLHFNGTHLWPTGTDQLETIEDNFDSYNNFSKVPVSITVLVLTSTMFVLILLIGLHCSSVAFRGTPSVKASSLKIIQVAYIGCYLTVIGIVCESIGTFLNNDRTRKCQLEQASFSVLFFGMTLIFATICVRTWRIYRIFVHFIDPGKFVSDKFLFVFIFFCFALELPVVLAWGIKVPIQPTIINLQHGFAQRRIYCTSDSHFSWSIVLLAYNATLLLISCYFALRCNKISQKDFKSNSILHLAYVLTIELTIGSSIYALIPRTHNPLPEYVTKHVTLLVYVISCCVFLFLPPILPQLKLKRKKYKSRISSISLKNSLYNKIHDNL